MYNASVAAWWLFGGEPADRALTGWCPFPANLDTQEKAEAFLLQALRSGGGQLYGTSPGVTTP